MMLNEINKMVMHAQLKFAGIDNCTIYFFLK